MAIECVRDLLRLDQIIGEEISQALVEGDVSVPETKASIARILDISGEGFISSREVIQDKVMIEGVLRYDILYVPEGVDQSIDTMEAEIGFTHYMDIPGAKPKMNSQLKLSIEHLDYELISGRKMGVKSVLNLYAQVNQVMELETLKEFKGLDDVEVLSEHIVGSSSAGVGHSQSMIREDIQLSDEMPSMIKIIRKDVKVKINEKKVTDNKVVVHGDLVVKLLYLCDDAEEPVQYISQNVPFSQIVDIAGAYQGMSCVADTAVSEFYAEPKENINNELRIIDLEIILGVNAQIFENQHGDVLIDAYSPSTVLSLKKRKIKLQETIGEGQGQTVIKESITFPEGVSPATKILYVDAKPVITDERIEDGKVIIEGILSTHIVYNTNDAGLVGSFKEDIPFKQSLEIENIDEDMDCQSEVLEEHAGFTLLAPDEVELKIVVTSKSIVTKTIEKDVLIGAEESQEGPTQDGGIYIYFVQPGDTLWSVAKKYNTTIANILKFNELGQEGQLSPGNKLMIFKKLNASVL